MKIRITAKKDGHCRAGMRHHGTKTHPADTFTPEQIEALEGDRMLVVEMIPEEGDDQVSEPGEEKAPKGKNRKDKAEAAPQGGPATDEIQDAAGAKAQD
jgi:hypothetical protein